MDGSKLKQLITQQEMEDRRQSVAMLGSDTGIKKHLSTGIRYSISVSFLVFFFFILVLDLLFFCSSVLLIRQFFCELFTCSLPHVQYQH